MKQQFAAKHPWMILAAGAAIQVLTGLPAAWGVFQQPVMEEYGLSEQGAGYAFALLIAAFGVGCVLGGFLQDKKGPRCAALWGTALLCGGFFAAAFLVALQPEKLTRWLGRLLCPCLLVLILVLFGGCLLHPLAGQYGTPTPEYTSGAVLQGVLYGYQTMDTLAALNFGAIIALNIQAQGVTRQEEVQRSTILAGFVAGGLLLAVYAMLGHAGALTGAAVPGLATGANVLTVLADRLFGKAGLVLLAAIFVLACFNTCVGLIACVGEYFHTLVPSVPYPAFAGFFAAASMLISNLGLADILRLSVPVLNALYPVAILLICLSFVPELEQRHPLVYPLCIGCTALQSVASALPLGPLSALAKALPFGAVGFGWVLPAAVGILAGMLLRPTPHEP
mgnify:CR=1 FL=1